MTEVHSKDSNGDLPLAHNGSVLYLPSLLCNLTNYRGLLRRKPFRSIILTGFFRSEGILLGPVTTIRL